MRGLQLQSAAAAPSRSRAGATCLPAGAHEADVVGITPRAPPVVVAVVLPGAWDRLQRWMAGAAARSHAKWSCTGCGRLLHAAPASRAVQFPLPPPTMGRPWRRCIAAPAARARAVLQHTYTLPPAHTPATAARR